MGHTCNFTIASCCVEVLASLSGGDGGEALSEEDVGAAVELRLEREDVLHVGVVGEGHELLEHVPRNLIEAFHINLVFTYYNRVDYDIGRQCQLAKTIPTPFFLVDLIVGASVWADRLNDITYQLAADNTKKVIATPEMLSKARRGAAINSTL